METTDKFNASNNLTTNLEQKKMSNVCRGCLAKECVMVKATLLEAIFNDLTGITISPTDGLPQWLCYECSALLHKCNRFRNKVLKTHDILCQYLQENVPFTDANISSPHLSRSITQYYEMPYTQTEQLSEEMNTVVHATDSAASIKTESVEVKEEMCSDYENNMAEEEYSEDHISNSLVDTDTDMTFMDMTYTETAHHEKQMEQGQLEEHRDVPVIKEEPVKVKMEPSFWDNDNITVEEWREGSPQNELTCNHETRRILRFSKRINYREVPFDSTSISEGTSDRRNGCIFCQKQVINYANHLLRHHTYEEEVQQLREITDPEPTVQRKKRESFVDILINRNNIHNNIVHTSIEDKLLIPSKSKNNRNSFQSQSNTVVCKNCSSTVSRSTLYRHNRYCKKNLYTEPLFDFNAFHNIPNLTHIPKEFRENVLPLLPFDDISDIVRNDPLIIAYGCSLHDKWKYLKRMKTICGRMRDLAHLLKTVRESHPEISNLQEVIDPKNYEHFKEAIKLMGGFDEKDGYVKPEEMPARTRRCLNIIKSMLIDLKTEGVVTVSGLRHYMATISQVYVNINKDTDNKGKDRIDDATRK